MKYGSIRVKFRPIVGPEYPPTESAGMDTKMHQTIAGHLAREYRRAGAGVEALDGVGIEEMRVRQQKRCVALLPVWMTGSGLRQE